MTKNKINPIGMSWEDHENELVNEGLLSKAEIAESEARVAIMSELIKARNEQQISQRELERLSGVRRPIIARMESGKTSPRIDTVIKVLAPLGKTLSVVSLEK
jgi:DNA-binding XRE family transcriptional regulator